MQANPFELTVCEAARFAEWETRFMALYLAAFTSGDYSGHYLDEEAERGWLRGLFAQHRAHCYVLHEGATLVAFLLRADARYDSKLPLVLRQQLQGQPAWAIAELAVAPAYRRRGLATRLIARCMADCEVEAEGAGPDAKTPRPQLIVRTQANALAARRLYERHGFTWWGAVQVQTPVREAPGLRWRQVEKHYYRWLAPV
ncbi:GNAT family N-acetyltransferase [Paraburkholderia hayleyella]|uniref:GNAT family N-acetyltransferase n=1 Tax=Paraburkholderia hayleyella TaxID=2152889 RepID=UPI0012917D5C|nr:GNAT family N-acetyltransferase [Paraburkholderia hayleyella]